MTPDTKNKWWDKWDKAAKTFDLMNKGIETRYGDKKRTWFSRSRGRTLLVAVGTGLDLQYFPAGLDIIGIDISEQMLEKAREKLNTSASNVTLYRGDIQNLGFINKAFDTVVTSCTFCSVPDPVAGLKELRRVIII